MSDTPIHNLGVLVQATQHGRIKPSTMLPLPAYKKAKLWHSAADRAPQMVDCRTWLNLFVPKGWMVEYLFQRPINNMASAVG